MGGIRETDEGVLVVEGAERTLTYTPRLVTLDDGTTIAHESQGGGLSSVWAADLGGVFVEVAHLGHGPVGGELVMTVTTTDDPAHTTVAVGDLWTDDVPAHVAPSWPVAVDLALGLVGVRTTLVHPDISKDQLEDLHQLLLGALHG
ncbi:hypothetical protein [Aeromicrobium sp.]|uniref:hypothetical protein n=1 Tax=Aeromicrobium sp. TaxID=1871063 RepID=UPI0019B74606|nr:hypothetical protein [Aeromicrobium sp.]MBC7632594.1 hypothetical protein [Aeromicrobium sp.]